MPCARSAMQEKKNFSQLNKGDKRRYDHYRLMWYIKKKVTCNPGQELSQKGPEHFTASVEACFVIQYVIGASFLRSNAPLVTGISSPMASLRRSSFFLCTIDDAISGMDLPSLTHSSAEE